MLGLTLRKALSFGVIVTCIAAQAPAAFIIDDRSFFDGRPHTLIDFESLGNGTPITFDILPFDTNFDIALNEYATQGVVFASEGGMGLARHSIFSWQEALRAGGSPTISAGVRGVEVGGMVEQDFQIFFSIDVKSVAFFVLTDELFPRPMFEALDEVGHVLGTFGLDEQTIDGQDGFVVYGFIGFASSTPIASVRLTSGVFAFDDLMFSSQIPAPGGVVALGAGVVVIGGRRRRAV